MLEEGDSLRNYTLRRFLGKGSYGEVWLAEKVIELANDSIPFALKILTPQSGETNNFTAVNTEIKTWIKAGNHLNIVPVHDGFVQGRFLIIVSEYVEDGSLRDWLVKNGNQAPSISKAVEMMRGILRGLDHLHAKRIVHRDLKPENILLRDEIPRITDFGVSRVVETFSENRTARYTKGAGAPMYMPPEAFSDCKPTPQLDTWSAGVLFYEMLTGACPFNADTLPMLLGEITNKEPNPLPPPMKELQEFVTTSLTKDVHHRFQTARQMAEALEQAWAQMKSQRKWQHGTLSHQATIVDPMLEQQDRPLVENTRKAHDNRNLLRSAQANRQTINPNRLLHHKFRWLTMAVILLVIAIGAGTWFGGARFFTKRVAQPNEDNAVDLMKQGKDCFDAKNFDCAIDCYTKQIALQPQSAEAYYWRARAYNKKGDFDHGINDFNKAIELRPSYAEAYAYRGAAYGVIGLPDEGLKDLTKAIKLNPQLYDGYFNRGLANRDNGDRDQAINDFDSAIALNPHDPRSFFERGFTYNGAGNYKEAIKDLNKAIQLGSDSSDVYRERGMAYLFEGDFDQAIKDLNTGLELNSRDAFIWYHRGLAYLNKQNHDQATSDLSQAIQLDPRLPEAFFYRGFAHQKSGHFLEAKNDFTAAIDLRPKYAEAYSMRAQIYQQLGQTADARRDIDKYRELAPVRPKTGNGQ